jgi:hypothetical protein
MVNLVHHFSCTGWNWEAFFNLVVTRVWQKLKLLILDVIPWFEEVTQHSSIGVSGWQQLQDLFLHVHLNLGLELVFENLEKFSKIENTFEIKIEQLTEAFPILFVLQTFEEVIELLLVMLVYSLRVWILNVQLLDQRLVLPLQMICWNDWSLVTTIEVWLNVADVIIFLLTTVDHNCVFTNVISVHGVASIT